MGWTKFTRTWFAKFTEAVVPSYSVSSRKYVVVRIYNAAKLLPMARKLSYMKVHMEQPLPL